MLHAEGLTYAHRGQASHYSFDLRALPGEITAITGPSGSGKSTLLDLIAGFLNPTSGSLTLDGLDLLPMPPEKRPVSILFQTDMLFEHLTALANAALGLPAGTPRGEGRARVAAALEQVGLPGIGSQVASTLSGGQKQRVALARTLLRDRPVLLLDEPFSALDDEARRGARDLVRRLTSERSWHTVLVSHNAEDIESLAQATYRMRNGVLTRSLEGA